jgi:glycine betaine/proline transport system substrate-binding protein
MEENPVMKRTRIVMLLSCGLVLALLLAACAGAAPATTAPADEAAGEAAGVTESTEAASAPSGDKPTIRLIANTWPASELNVNVAANLLQNELGYPTEIIALDEQAQWDALAGGDADASLEVWPSGHGERIAQYIDEQQVVENGGELGVVGRIAWYTPQYVVDANPALGAWEGYADPAVAQEFATAETGDKGTFFAGPLGWTQYDQQIADALDLNFQVINTASEEALLAQVSSKYERQEPVLFYFYTPHAVFTRFDLAQVELPACTQEEHAAKAAAGNVDCAYPEDRLIKIFNPQLKEVAPDAYNLLKNFNYTTDDQIEMLGMLDGGMTVEEAAQAWIDAHPDTWQAWLGQ